MGEPEETTFSLEQLERVLSKLDKAAILVGGQALVFWVDYFNRTADLSQSHEGITRDADFLGDRSTVAGLADALKAKATYPPQRAITALVGQVTVSLADDAFLNIDVIGRIVGIDADAVRKRAVTTTLGETNLLVMHPLDVLHSRVENLAQLESKQNSEGVAQTKLALAVAKAYSETVAMEPDGDKLALKAIEHVVTIAKSSAGRKVSKEYGIEFLSSIPFPAISNENFRTHRMPRIVEELAVSQPALSLQAFLDQGKYSVKVLNVQSGQYEGTVLWTDGHHAAQRVGQGKVAVHDVSEWSQKPVVGSRWSVKYKEGVITPRLTPPKKERDTPSPGW